MLSEQQILKAARIVESKLSGQHASARMVLGLRVAGMMGAKCVDIKTLATIADASDATVKQYGSNKMEKYSVMIHASRKYDDVATLSDVVREFRARGEKIADLSTSTRRADVDIDDLLDIDLSDLSGETETETENV
jgi:hypothetical protein